MYNVLLVDDDIYIRQGLRNLIQWNESGFSIAGEAGNGMEAYDWMLRHRPDVVITDIRMPVLDGLELAAKAAAEYPSPVFFIIVSGYEDFKYAQQAVRCGVRDYLLKPIDEDELRLALSGIASHLRQARLTGPAAADGIDSAPGRLEQIKRHIDGHFREELSLKSIAAEFYMNPVYLGQLFRRTYGILFNDYLLALRIEAAKKLLRSTDMLVYEIAEYVGFNTPSYFVAQFEKLERMKPSRFRSLHRSVRAGKDARHEANP